MLGLASLTTGSAAGFLFAKINTVDNFFLLKAICLNNFRND
jgi:hypothetical protein